MNAERLAAVFLIASFVSVTFSSLINAPGLYTTQDINQRLQMIETYRRRWLTSQALVVLYFPLTIVGFSLLASILQSGGKGWIPVLGAVAIVLGTLAGPTLSTFRRQILAVGTRARTRCRKISLIGCGWRG